MVRTSIADMASPSRMARVTVMAFVAMTVLSGLLTWWLYVVGDQPIVWDSRGYFNRAVRISNDGLLNYAIIDGSKRTYGYPWFVSFVVQAVGSDPLTVRAVVATVQWVLFVPIMAGSTWVVARELGGRGYRLTMYSAAMLNPVLLISAGMILTDFLSAVLSGAPHSSP